MSIINSTIRFFALLMDRFIGFKMRIRVSNLINFNRKRANFTIWIREYGLRKQILDMKIIIFIFYYWYIKTQMFDSDDRVDKLENF